MSLDLLLGKLEAVKATGRGTWLARCPAHEDGRPSLSIRDADGVTLLHCFAGCSAGDVVGAVGMELSDLFPPKPEADHRPGMRRPFPAADVLQALAGEAQIVRVAAATQAAGGTLTEADRLRLAKAQERISEGARLANG